MGTDEQNIWLTDGLGKELRRWRVPNIIASDLLEFRAIPLWQNQECREARQDSRVDRAEAASFMEQAIHAIPVLTLPCVGELYYILNIIYIIYIKYYEYEYYDLP